MALKCVSHRIQGFSFLFCYSILRISWRHSRRSLLSTKEFSPCQTNSRKVRTMSQISMKTVYRLKIYEDSCRASPSRLFLRSISFWTHRCKVENDKIRPFTRFCWACFVQRDTKLSRTANRGKFVAQIC